MLAHSRVPNDLNSRLRCLLPLRHATSLPWPLSPPPLCWEFESTSPLQMCHGYGGMRSDEVGAGFFLASLILSIRLKRMQDTLGIKFMTREQETPGDMLVTLNST